MTRYIDDIDALQSFGELHAYMTPSEIDGLNDIGLDWRRRGTVMSLEDAKAFVRGRRKYPGNPYPQLQYGYRWMPESRLPSTCSREGLERRVVEQEVERNGGKVLIKSVQLKVPLKEV